MAATNTIVIYNVAKADIPLVKEQLNDANLPGLYQVNTISFLRRLVLQFTTPEAASAAEPILNEQIKSVSGAHIGHAINNNKPCNSCEAQTTHLELPDPGTLWLISPPPSPPLEWQSSLEEKPNDRIHFEEELNLRLLQSSLTHNDCQMTPALSPRTIMIMEACEDKPGLQLTEG